MIHLGPYVVSPRSGRSLFSFDLQNDTDRFPAQLLDKLLSLSSVTSTFKELLFFFSIVIHI